MDCRDGQAEAVEEGVGVDVTAGNDSEEDETMMCRLCEDNGFDLLYQEYAIPNSDGMTCSDLQTLSAAEPFDSPSCFQYKEMQGYCCPKCFLCGEYEDNDDGMMYPDNKGIVTTSDNIEEVEVVSCREMMHRYHMLSYFTESCPIVVGVDLMGLCGCPSSLNAAVVDAEQRVCNFCPEGTVLNVENAEFTVGNTVMTCRDGETFSRYITDVDNCIVNPAKDDACCVVADETVASSVGGGGVSISNDTVANNITEGINTTDVGATTTVMNPTTLNDDTQYANELASKIKITIEMEKNFDHGVDCSLGDWELCYTKNVIIDYFGDLDYSNK